MPRREGRARAVPKAAGPAPGRLGLRRAHSAGLDSRQEKALSRSTGVAEGSAVPIRRSIPHRAEPLCSSAAPTVFPLGIAGDGATRRRRRGVCASPPAAMPALGIEADGSLPATASMAGSASAIRSSWCNRKVASDMRNRHGVRRNGGSRAQAPQPPMHTRGPAPCVPHRPPESPKMRVPFLPAGNWTWPAPTGEVGGMAAKTLQEAEAPPT